MKLKEGGVSDAVVQAMQEAQVAQQSTVDTAAANDPMSSGSPTGVDLVNTAWKGPRWRTDRSGKPKGNSDSYFIRLLQGSLCEMPEPEPGDATGFTCSWKKLNDSVSVERRYLGTAWTETFTLSVQGSELAGRSKGWDTSHTSVRQNNYSYRLQKVAYMPQQ